MKQKHQTRTILLRWLAYAGLLLLCATLQTVPRLFQWGEVRPLWIIPACLAMSLYEGEFAGALCGAFGGLLWDAAAGRVGGYFAIMLLIACFLAGCLWQQYLRDNTLNFAWITLLTALVLLSIDFIISYWLRGLPGPAMWYLTVLLPMCGATCLAGLLLRPAARAIGRIQPGVEKKKP